MSRRVYWLGGIAVLLGVYSVADLLMPASPEADVANTHQAVSGAEPAGESAALNPLAGLSEQSFAAIAERPLFNPGRAPRPAEPPPVPVVAAPEPPPPSAPATPGPGAGDYKLLAVASGPSGRVAALRIQSSGEVAFLREGQSIDSWSILAVGDRSVTIGTPEQSVEFNLFQTEDQGAAEQEKPETSDPPTPDAPEPDTTAPDPTVADPSMTDPAYDPATEQLPMDETN